MPPKHVDARYTSTVPMAVGYGGTEPQLASGAVTLLSAVVAFRKWLGDNRWRDVVPLTKGAASFTFLLTAAPSKGEAQPPRRSDRRVTKRR